MENINKNNSVIYIYIYKHALLRKSLHFIEVFLTVPRSSPSLLVWGKKYYIFWISYIAIKWNNCKFTTWGPYFQIIGNLWLRSVFSNNCKFMTWGPYFQIIVNLWHGVHISKQLKIYDLRSVFSNNYKFTTCSPDFQKIVN